ncbi:Ig-like domain-containing protein [Taibaiella koreensis]|uniref:Ig-like domain-containing protein n=1 Tax=Taibaiella koreensis TaxID=1268548 RepID=UPI0013C2CBA9|nr:PKD domain-containing protein [Taibaiella koreensis]
MKQLYSIAFALLGLLWRNDDLFAQIAAACNPTFSVGCSGYRIYNFTYAGINNSPTTANCGVSNYLSQVATVTAGVPTPYSLQMGLWMNYAIYADFDNNGNFNGANELLFASGGAPPWNAGGMVSVSGNLLTIPATVAPGSYRLRVLGVWTGPTLLAGMACNSFSLAGGGNFHDYTLAVVPPCAAPAAPVATAVSRCGPGSITLTATAAAGTTINWYSTATGGTPLATGNSYTVPLVAASTTYYAAAAINAACISTRTAVPVTILQLPQVNLGNDTTICPGVTQTLLAGPMGNTYAWNTGAGTPGIPVNVPGNYSVLVTAANGCTASDAIQINAGQVPVNVLPGAVDLCAGSTTVLNAGNAGCTFLWTPGSSTTQAITVSAGGSYSVSIKSPDGCTINGVTHVVLRPLPLPALRADTSICEGDTIVLDAGNPGYSYNWNTGSTARTINAADSGSYIVTIVSPFNCHIRDRDSTHIAFQPAPYVEGFNFVPLFYEALGKVKFYPLVPSDVLTYQWDFGDNTPSSFLQEPVHQFALPGSYEVQLKVSNNCSDYTVKQSIYVTHTTVVLSTGSAGGGIVVYPNPAKDFMEITVTGNQRSLAGVSLYNLSGTILLQQKINGTQIRLPLAPYPAGLYLLKIQTSKGNIVSKIQIEK